MNPFGRYELLEKLGAGGMAEVFAAKAFGSDGFVKELVIKRILPAYSADEEFRALFIREATLTVGLTHANIVQVLDFGRIDDSYFIAMERVDGVDLARLLARQAGPLPPEMSQFLMSQVLLGLDFAHRKGIVHRDISPSNILVSYEGEVKLGDFGIARAASQVSHTKVGYVRGKPAYMSPEQAQDQELDGRSDVFACGLVMHEMLTGKPVFGFRDDARNLAAVVNAGIPLPSSIVPTLPQGLDRVVMRALRRSPDARYESAAAFQQAIEDFAEVARQRLRAKALAVHVQTLVPRSAARPLAGQTTVIVNRRENGDGLSSFVSTGDQGGADRLGRKGASPWLAGLAVVLAVGIFGAIATLTHSPPIPAATPEETMVPMAVAQVSGPGPLPTLARDSRVLKPHPAIGASTPAKVEGSPTADGMRAISFWEVETTMTTHMSKVAPSKKEGLDVVDGKGVLGREGTKGHWSGPFLGETVLTPDGDTAYLEQGGNTASLDVAADGRSFTLHVHDVGMVTDIGKPQDADYIRRVDDFVARGELPAAGYPLTGTLKVAKQNATDPRDAVMTWSIRPKGEDGRVALKEAAATSRRRSVRAGLMNAQLWLDKGNPQWARQLLTNSLLQAPDDPELLAMYARVDQLCKAQASSKDR